MAKALKYAAIGLGAVALIATGVGAVAFGAAVGTLTVAGVSTGTLLLASAGLSAAASLLEKRPGVPSSMSDRLTANIDPRASRKTVLGSTAMPCDVRYVEWFGKDQERCGWIVALASHRIDGVDEIWFDDELAWSAGAGTAAKFAGYFWVRALRTEGRADNTVTFGSGRWNGSCRMLGCAYAFFEFKVTGIGKKAESPFAGGIPSRVTIIGRGSPLYDPRRDGTVAGGAGAMRAADEVTWRYTADDGAALGENLALQALRTLIGGRIAGKLATGCGVPLRRLDLPSFATAANLCDEMVNRSTGGMEPRFRGAAVLSEGDDPSGQLEMLLAACCGRLTDVGGKIGLAIAHNDLAEAAADDGLNTDDVIGAFTWNPDPSLEETPNVVRGKYSDATRESLYQLLPYPDVTLPQGAAGEIVMPLDLAAAESASQCQRIAKQALQRKQYGRSFSAPFDIRAWKYRQGQVLPFTFAPLGFDRRLFRVVEQDPGSIGECVMTLREENAAIYAWDADDRAPVRAAEPIIYDSRNNPLILAIGEAATTAFWDQVTGEAKPQDNATVGTPAGTFVAGVEAGALVGTVESQALQQLRARADVERTRLRDRALAFPGPEGETSYTLVRREVAERREEGAAFAQVFALIGAVTPDGTAFVINGDTVEVDDGQSFAQRFAAITASLGANAASIEDVQDIVIGPEGAAARAVLQLDVNNRIVGRTLTNDGSFGEAVFAVDRFRLQDPDTGDDYLFADETGVKMRRIEVDTLAARVVQGVNLDTGSMGKGAMDYDQTAVDVGGGDWKTVAQTSVLPRYGKPIVISFSAFAASLASDGSTAKLLRVILDDGTVVWGGRADSRSRFEDEGRTISWTCGTGSIAGRPTTVSVQAKDPGSGSEVVRFVDRYLQVVELSRLDFDSFDVGAGTGADSNPTSGAGGGGGYDPNQTLDYNHANRSEIQP